MSVAPIRVEFHTLRATLALTRRQCRRESARPACCLRLFARFTEESLSGDVPTCCATRLSNLPSAAGGPGPQRVLQNAATGLINSARNTRAARQGPKQTTPLLQQNRSPMRIAASGAAQLPTPLPNIRSPAQRKESRKGFGRKRLHARECKVPSHTSALRHWAIRPSIATPANGGSAIGHRRKQCHRGEASPLPSTQRHKPVEDRPPADSSPIRSWRALCLGVHTRSAPPKAEPTRLSLLAPAGAARLHHPPGLPHGRTSPQLWHKPGSQSLAHGCCRNRLTRALPRGFFAALFQISLFCNATDPGTPKLLETRELPALQAFPRRMA